MVCPRTRARLRGEAGGFSNQGGADGRDDKAREGHAFLEGEEISTSKVVLEVRGGRRVGGPAAAGGGAGATKGMTDPWRRPPDLPPLLYTFDVDW
jgi:hypothetical protein